MRIFQRIHKKLNWSGRRYVALIAGVLALSYIASAIYHVYKPLPDGLNFTGKLRHAEVKFLSDQTYVNAQGQQQQDHQIFDEILNLIHQAKTTIVLDMFLFNSETGESKLTQRPLTQQLTQALIQKRHESPNVEITGNPDVQPTIYDNFEAKISAFDYAFISYNVSHVKDQVMMYVERKGYNLSQTNVNISSLTQHSFNVGMPVPFMIFSKPMSEIMKFNFNPDKINFLYLYAGYQFQDIKDIQDKKGMWFFNVSGQFILPKGIKFSPTLMYSTKGNYYFFQSTTPIMNRLDLTLSKKFNHDRLQVTLYANDIFNSSRMYFKTVNSPNPIYLYNRNDTRSFGISVNYKIPTRNKLAKVDQNILNQDAPKEDNGGIMKQ